MSKGTLKLNYYGVRALLQSAEIGEAILGFGQEEATRLGDGYTAELFQGRDRVHCFVSTTSDASASDNLENNTLLKGTH